MDKCSICGSKLTKFGNKKLADGIVCRNCVKKASEWLTDEDYARRSIEDFKKHLQYREANQNIVNNFEPERVVEGKYNLYLDRDNREFVISKRKDYKKDNADVLKYDDIKELTIFEEKDETDNYNLLMDIKLKNDEIDNVCFRVNEFPGISRDSAQYKDAMKKAYEYLNSFDEEDGIDFVEVKND